MRNALIPHQRINSGNSSGGANDLPNTGQDECSALHVAGVTRKVHA